MSIVAVHGPYTFGSKATVAAGPAKASVNPSNGLIWNFSVQPASARPAVDFDWTFPGGTPASQADSQGPIAVTYAGAGSQTATLTVSGASTLPPANGSYPITVTTVSGAAPQMMMMAAAPLDTGVDQGSGGQEADTTTEPYDPSAHTVDEVKTYAEGKSDDEIQAILDAEVAGKNRSTLVSALEGMLPYDPSKHTVDEVVTYAEANPDEVQGILDAEVAGKNRSTLVSQLEALL